MEEIEIFIYSGWRLATRYWLLPFPPGVSDTGYRASRPERLPGGRQGVKGRTSGMRTRNAELQTFQVLLLTIPSASNRKAPGEGGSPV